MKGRLVDLSYTLKPGKESRLFEKEMILSSQVADVHNLPGQWYIMHNLRMVTHIGTHIELPYHILEDGADAASHPLERLVGEAVVMDFRGREADTAITVGDMEAAAAKAGGIRPGDLVLLHTGWDRYWDMPEYAHPPYTTPEAAQWLVDQGAALVGTDTHGAEVPGNDDHIIHHTWLDRGIAQIENLCNMGALTKSRVFLFAAPIAAVGLESMPLRVVALEEE